MREDATEGRLTEMDNTRGSGQEGGNDNPQMTELRNMVQMLGKLVGGILRKLESQEWIGLGTTIADYEGSFTNPSEYAPHLVATNEMRARRFEDGLRHEIKRVIRPLVLPTYAEVLDRAIIVEQDEIERKKYFDSKRRQNFGGEGTRGQKKQKPEMKSRNFGNNPKGQVQVCQKCGSGTHKGELSEAENRGSSTEGRSKRRNVRPTGNTRPGCNRLGNPGNRDGNVNNQRQGRAFALMPGDARNTEDVVAGMGLQFIA
ncbi:hypothetical protein Acr_00g0086060 [Actinidia rufa]|uniref:Uncharacterized protein n=1 Tax=Actinidia rufa TaxID=165716 RepID=A0A7J0DVU2_9ERIC|nr:hypothetical protein Acr_00g0086060 [Actinidia rufa]